MSNVSDREHASTALAIVQRFYAALARGDVAGVIALLAPDIEWTEAEGFPYYSGTWRSPQAVLDNLFARIGQDWDAFSAITHSYLTENDQVVAFGDYGGITVNSVLPGPVMTDRRRAMVERMAASRGIGMADAIEAFVTEAGISRFGAPGDIAALVAFLVSPGSRWMTGSALRMDGGEIKAL